MTDEQTDLMLRQLHLVNRSLMLMLRMQSVQLAVQLTSADLTRPEVQTAIREWSEQ